MPRRLSALSRGRDPSGLDTRATSMATVVQPRRVLIVGDGDLSYSLALQRAFGSVIELTATVLPSAQELPQSHPPLRTFGRVESKWQRSRGTPWRVLIPTLTLNEF